MYAVCALCLLFWVLTATTLPTLAMALFVLAMASGVAGLTRDIIRSFGL